MTLVVQKFGGTSVADPDRIRRVARHVVDTRDAGHDVVVVVSAMGKQTDELERLAREVSPEPAPREMDMLLTAGERISMSLLCMAINDLGVEAVSFTGSQAGIVTDTSHGKAKILEVKGDRLREAIALGRVCVVAGFQGVSTDRDVTTLGRGGSDTTAVALAAVLDAEACELYTDVDGIFTADPRIVSDAEAMATISFDEMLEMVASGCPKPEMRAVEFARNYQVPLHVRSSFTWQPGTMIQEADPDMEQAIISAVTHDTSEAKVTISGVPDEPGIAARIFRALADANVNVDMIVQNVSHAGLTDISFTVPQADAASSRRVLDDLGEAVGIAGTTHDDDIGRVSLVGAGMGSNPGVAARMFETLADHGINIEMISTSSIRISCVVRKDKVTEAVRLLHDAFELGAA